ncbi:hypothetical protein bpr_III077 [Butyrivibrio proteoclasticus B316]|uniref:Uncharacterized protein n=1 Tax=Butyrivibrio proteoclasticus (strain ATCC 51982 / DSM 14932 / B316) TaxID=515622 RepID=E0S2Y3_BUTPB|nr:hypothetical protein bpr_III077 [Butyrivibrio proteoclasticus B316]
MYFALLWTAVITFFLYLVTKITWYVSLYTECEPLLYSFRISDSSIDLCINLLLMQREHMFALF